MKKINDLLTTEFLPVITGGLVYSTEERLLALAQKLGGLGTLLFSEISDIEYENSRLITKLTCEMIISEDRGYQPGQEIKMIKIKLATTKSNLLELRERLNSNQNYLDLISLERGASS